MKESKSFSHRLQLTVVVINAPPCFRDRWVPSLGPTLQLSAEGISGPREREKGWQNLEDGTEAKTAPKKGASQVTTHRSSTLLHCCILACKKILKHPWLMLEGVEATFSPPMSSICWSVSLQGLLSRSNGVSQCTVTTPAYVINGVSGESIRYAQSLPFFDFIFKIRVGRIQQGFFQRLDPQGASEDRYRRLVLSNLCVYHGRYVGLRRTLS